MDAVYRPVSVLLYRLRVVSTRVGGVPEVLPSDMIRLADPSVEGRVTHVK